MTPTAMTPAVYVELHRDQSTRDTMRWTAFNGRFVVVCNPASGGDPLSYDITDTGRTDWVGRSGQGNVVRVYETADIRPLIATAIRRSSRRRA